MNERIEHPADETLEGWADGVLDRTEREAVGSHLERCPLCRARASEWQELLGALEALPAPEPGPALRSRVLEELRRPAPDPLVVALGQLPSLVPPAGFAGRVLARYRAERHRAERRHPFAVRLPRGLRHAAALVVLGPALGAAAILAVLLLHPLLHPGDLLGFAAWRSGELLRDVFSAGASLVPGWGGSGLSPLGAPGLLAGVLGAAWTLTALATWTLHRTLTSPYRDRPTMAARHQSSPRLPVLFLLAGTLTGTLAAAPPSLLARQAEPQTPSASATLLSSEITVSPREAALALTLGDGRTLTLVLEGGRARIDGSDAGAAPEGGVLERSWRELLGRAVAADAERLPGILLGWTPPAGLPQGSDQTAALLVERLGSTLAGITPPEPREGALRVHVGESLTIGAGEVIPGAVALFGGSLRVEGELGGDLLAVGARVEIAPGGAVAGDVRLSGGELLGDRSGIGGTVIEMAELPSPIAGASPPQPPGPAVAPPPSPGDLGDQIRREVREATRDAIAGSTRAGRDRGSSALGRIGSGFAALVQTVLTFAVLLAVGVILLRLAPGRFDGVTATVRNVPIRSGLAGMAGIVLAFPLWIVGIVLLAVSIIGIPLLVVWIPAWPLAVAASIVVGYLAVARLAGGWILRGEPRHVGRFDLSTPAGTLAAGLAVLLGAFALAALLRMAGPWFGGFHGLLLALAVAVTSLAACVGFGAILASKGGEGPGTTPEPAGIAPDPGPEVAADGGLGEGSSRAEGPASDA